MKIMRLTGLMVVYLLVSFGSWWFFRGQTTSSTDNQMSETKEQNVEEVDTTAYLITVPKDAVKDQSCPLNGKMYTEAEKAAWDKRRPLAVMIENTPDARPQSGLSQADVVYEAIAEGGVTRMMGLFYCDAQVKDITLAPIRSARTYFIDWASGYNQPLYVHVGGANVPGPTDALGQLSDYGWTGQNDLNQFSIGYPTFVRDYNRLAGREIATEHTMVTSTEKLWAVGLKRKWTNLSPERKLGKKTIGGVDWQTEFQPWKFQDGAAGAGPQTISFEFWDGYAEYGVKWEYDQTNNTYKRFIAGEPATDLNNQQQISASNAIVLFTDEKGPINDKKHMLYRTTGTGDALIFQNGQTVKAKWSKKDRESELSFNDSKGKEVELVRGLTWISVVAKNTAVTY